MPTLEIRHRVYKHWRRRRLYFRVVENFDLQEHEWSFRTHAEADAFVAHRVKLLTKLVDDLEPVAPWEVVDNLKGTKH